MTKKRIFLIPLFFGLILVLSLSLLEVEGSSEPKKIITLYQSGPSLVIENEELELEDGLNKLIKYLPESVVTRTIFTTSPDASLRRSKTFSAVNSQEGLLGELVGDIVSVVKSNSSGTVVKGELIGIFSGKPLVKTADNEMRLIDNPEEYRFESFPPGSMETRLELELFAPEKTETKLTVGYQLSKLNWSPQYVGFLDEEEETLTIRGVAHINNQTGWEFQGVQLWLLAGEPRRETETKYFALARAQNAPESSSPEQVFEYYRYKVGFPVDLSRGVETQIKFLHKESVDYRKYYLFEPYSSPAVRTIMELTNTEEEGLGIPVASGAVRIYEDTDEKTFIGEDSLPNLPVGEDVELELGDTFDVKGERTRLNHDKIGERIWKDQVELTVNNEKEKPVRVTVRERLSGDWEILRSSQDYEEVDSRTIKYEVTVPAKESVEISYLVQYEL